MKRKQYHTVELFLRSNIKIVERGTIDTTNTQIDDLSPPWWGYITAQTLS